MNTAPQGTLTTIARLRAALDETAAALAAADLDRLLAGEMALQAALDAVPVEGFRPKADAAITPEERMQLRRELEAAAAATRRCRRLGATLSDFVRISLDARGGQLGYEPDAGAAAAALAGRGVSVRA
jgi:hypothetical protein